MFVLRTMGMTPSLNPNDDKDEHMIVFVEDPTAPSRLQRRHTQASSHSNNSHTTWTCCAVGTQQPTAIGSTPPARSNPTPGGGQNPPPPPPTQFITPFDAFLQRVLLTPQGQSGQAGSSTASVEGQWTPRTTAVSLEGFVFHVGADRAAGSGVGDWQVKVASVVVKGGAASGTMRGVIVEVSQLMSSCRLSLASTDCARALRPILSAGNLPRCALSSTSIRLCSQFLVITVPASKCSQR